MRILSVTLEEFIAKTLEQLPLHPLTVGASYLAERVRKISVDADVGSEVLVANYDVPVLGSSAVYRLDPTVQTLDSLAAFVPHLIGSVVGSFEDKFLTRLSGRGEDGFLGIGTFIPPTVGTNVVGGINEGTLPGWRSQVKVKSGGIISAMMSLEHSCTARGRSPDVTMLGTNAYTELILAMQPQQRFVKVRHGIPMLALNAGVVYRDSYADPKAVYVLHTDDFNLTVAPSEVSVQATPDGRLRITVKRAEQLVSRRRFRSGTIVIPPGLGSPN